MPVTLAQIARNRAHLVVDFGGGVLLNVDYRPASVTPRQAHLLQALQQQPFEQLSPTEQAELVDYTPKTLAESVIDWDLFEPNPDGTPSDRKIPPTLEALQDVDILFQATVLKAIMEDQRVGKLTGAPANVVDGSLARPASSAASSTPSPWDQQPVTWPPPVQTGTNSGC